MLPIPERAPDTVPVVNATPLHAFLQSWKLAPPRDYQILVVKGTFALIENDVARPVDEHELPTGELPHEDAPDGCLRYPGDTALYKPRCDVLLAGHAYGPRSGPAVTHVQIRLGRALDHTVAVIGDRTWRGGVPTPPDRFERLELRADRAFGGPDVATNPVGRGRPSEDGARLPNLEDPARLIRSPRDAPPPALTTPLSSMWASRQRFIGTYGGRWADDRAPYLPEDFDWRYFNAAPEPLQIDYPRGDEHYFLGGVTANRQPFQGRLPGVVVRAHAQRVAKPNELTEIQLRLDTVFFDADAMQVHLVWRGATEASDLYGSDLASVFVRAEMAGRPLAEDAVFHSFAETVRAQYELELEDDVDEPADEPADDEAPPEGRRPPLGLRPSQAVALGLPAWSATMPERASRVPPPAAPPPAASTALTREEVLARRAAGEPLDGEDMREVDLRGADLTGQSFDGADLSGADLRGANLSEASLVGALLQDANLDGANLEGADLSEAVLIRARLANANLGGATLADATMSEAASPGARYEGATLTGLLADGADLSACNFVDADLTDADLSGARLEGTRMNGATIQDLRLYEARAEGLILDDAKGTALRAEACDLTRASFVRMKAAESIFRESKLVEADFRHAELPDSVFDDVDAERATFNQADLSRGRFPRAKARRARFVKANLLQAHFESAHFEGADLRGANLYEANTFEASFLGANLENAILGNSGL